MLHYIYADSLPDVHEIMGSSSSCSLTIMVQHLLAAADHFGLDRLKLLCESKLCDEITVETVSTTLSLAEQHRCMQLKTACLKFAAANLNGASTLWNLMIFCQVKSFLVASFVFFRVSFLQLRLTDHVHAYAWSNLPFIDLLGLMN